MRYDACVIGAGPEGLAAAATLAGGGLKVAVVERNARCGGRCVTREFHPGFHASPFVDELPPIPPDVFWSLGLMRHGAVFAPAFASLALWPDRRSTFVPWFGRHAALERAEALRAAIVARVMADAERPLRRRLFAWRATAPPWPGEELASRSFDDLLDDTSRAPDDRAHLAALTGQVCDPSLAGSAFAVLAGTASGGMIAGGLGRLGDALRKAAEDAGATITCGLEATDIRRKKERVVSVGLADRTEIAARAVISTLDLKRTFLSLFAWADLPRAVVDRAGAFRPAPGVARLLVALKDRPDSPAGTAPCLLRGPIYVAPGGLGEAYRAWRGNLVPQHPPATVRILSAIDPSLAPVGAASVSVTLGGIPHTLFNGNWGHDKRESLRETALTALEAALPGARQNVVASELIVPPDIEDALGITSGDLMGGEIAADQMLAFRPFAACRAGRTPVKGLYLAGSSSVLGPLATCASGVAAARALLADIKAGQLK